LQLFRTSVKKPSDIKKGSLFIAKNPTKIILKTMFKNKTSGVGMQGPSQLIFNHTVSFCGQYEEQRKNPGKGTNHSGRFRQLKEVLLEC